MNIKIRVETNEKLKEMIENINADLTNKIQQEIKERENSNNCMLSLLEESCNKIENYFTQVL